MSGFKYCVSFLTVAESAPVVAVAGARVRELVVDAGAVVALVALARVDSNLAQLPSPALRTRTGEGGALLRAFAVVVAGVLIAQCADYNFINITTIGWIYVLFFSMLCEVPWQLTPSYPS